MIPKQRTMILREYVAQLVDTPKKAFDSRSIVVNPIRNPSNIPPRCVKLSTKGVRPMRQLITISKVSHHNTFMCRNLIPWLLSFNSVLNSRFQFDKISAIHAPISPKIPPEAPTLMYSGNDIADIIVPPMAGMTNKPAVARKP